MILEAVGDGNGPERERKETGTLHDTMCVFFLFVFFIPNSLFHNFLFIFNAFDSNFRTAKFW